MKKLKIRKILFGIRFKFSIIIIMSVMFVSALIGSALLNQQEKKIKESLQRQGSVILDGLSDQARSYLRNQHQLSSDQGMQLSPALKINLYKQQAESLKKMGQFISTVFGKEYQKKIDKLTKKDIDNTSEIILDIAFMVDVNWKDIGTNWKRADQTLYIYFDQKTGMPFFQKNGRNDPLLEPSIVSHFMNNVDTRSYIGFVSASDVPEMHKILFKDKPNYVIVGIPIVQDQTPLYDDYIQFRKRPLVKSNLEKYLQIKNDLTRKFIQRIIYLGLNLDYIADIKSETNKKFLLNFLYGKSSITHLKATQVQELIKEFSAVINTDPGKGLVPLSRMQTIWHSIQNKYGIPFQPAAPELKIWRECFFYLTQKGVPLTSAQSLDELALISFKKDLAGILGLFVDRTQYYPAMASSTIEIVNLMVSILLRAIFLALLFPTFIIRSIKRLADGAVEIGKGNFDKQIEIRGSDEIGRLADILNIMTLNLKKAEEMKIEKVRMEKELVTAQQIQAALLPERLPVIRGMEFGAYYSAQTESGGDYYDFIELGEGNLGITIADVSGHGVGSGLVMAMTRTLLHTYCTKSLNTKKILEIINDYLKNNTASNYFVTMFYGILNLSTMKLTYSSAGHCLPVLIRNGMIRQLPAGGIALGATSGEMFAKLAEIKEVQLQKGDYFVQYTDGVDEAMNADGKEFGLERFEKVLLASTGTAPQEMIKSVVQAIDAFTGSIPQHDDITMIMFRIL